MRYFLLLSSVFFFYSSHLVVLADDNLANRMTGGRRKTRSWLQPLWAFIHLLLVDVV